MVNTFVFHVDNAVISCCYDSFNWYSFTQLQVALSNSLLAVSGSYGCLALHALMISVHAHPISPATDTDTGYTAHT